MVTLEQLLDSRDARAACQRKMLQEYPDCALICLTVQFPGPEKRSRSSLVVGEAGLAAVKEAFGQDILQVLVRDLETGYEAYFPVCQPSLAVKERCCEIEDTHPLGRLMDIDVLPGKREAGPERSFVQPLSREDLHLPPRRCLLCRHPARICMRSHAHSTADLLAKIDEMVNIFLNS